jgi:hypothetical protein
MPAAHSRVVSGHGAGSAIRTALLLAGLTALIMVVGRAIGGTNGMMLGLVIAGVINFASYGWSEENSPEIEERIQRLLGA